MQTVSGSSEQTDLGQVTLAREEKRGNFYHNPKGKSIVEYLREKSLFLIMKERFFNIIRKIIEKEH